MEKEINKEKQENMKVHFKDFDIVFKTKTLDIQNDLPIIYEIFNTFLQEIYVEDTQKLCTSATVRATALKGGRVSRHVDEFFKERV